MPHCSNMFIKKTIYIYRELLGEEKKRLFHFIKHIDE